MNRPNGGAARSSVTGEDAPRAGDATVDAILLPSAAMAEDIARDTTDPGSPLPTTELDPIDRTYRVAVVTLTTGFRIGGALLVAGLVVSLLRDQSLHDRADPLSDVVRAIGRGEGPAVVDLAIMTLIATPVVAALAISASFARAGDRVYAGLSLAVLLILGTSITLALLR